MKMDIPFSILNESQNNDRYTVQFSSVRAMWTVGFNRRRYDVAFNVEPRRLLES